MFNLQKLFGKSSATSTRPSRGKTNARPRRLSVQTLENRRVLAGLVAFTEAAGTLTITGDVDANAIEISQGPGQPAGSFVVRSLDTGTGIATRFAGRPANQTSETFNNINNIVVDMSSGGSDRVEFAGAESGASVLNGDLTVDFGGASELEISDMIVGNLSVNQSIVGNAIRVLNNVTVTGATTLDSVNGGTNNSITGSRLGTGLSITNNAGTDELTLTDTDIGGGVAFPLPAAGYLSTVLSINNGEGPALTRVANNALTTVPSPRIHGGVSLVSGTGFDTMVLTNAVIDGGVNINNGNGDSQGDGATVMIIGGVIGGDLLNAEGLTIINGTQRDILMINGGAVIPSGIDIDNQLDPNGSDLDIEDATIGGNPEVVSAINVNGLNNVNISGTTVLNGNVNFAMASTVLNQVLLEDLRVNGRLLITSTGVNSRDLVTLRNVNVTSRTEIQMGGAADELTLTGTTSLSQVVVLNSGNQVGDRLIIDAALLTTLGSNVSFPFGGIVLIS